MTCTPDGLNRLLIGTNSLPTAFTFKISKKRAVLTIPDAERDHVHKEFAIKMEFTEAGVIRTTAELQTSIELYRSSTPITFTFNGNSYILQLTNFTYKEKPATTEGTFFEYTATAEVVKRL